MPKATGYSALAGLTTFTAKQWFTKSFVSLVDEISLRYGKRTEVLDGGVVTKGTHLTAEICDLSVTEMKVIMGGVMGTVAAISDKDCIDPETGYGEPIFSDGSAGDTLVLATSAKAFITLIFCNSNGSGSTSTTPMLIAVIAGTGASPTATAHLTTAEINSALANSTGVHAGVTEWGHVARWEVHQASLGALQNFAENRNNHLTA